MFRSSVHPFNTPEKNVRIAFAVVFRNEEENLKNLLNQLQQSDALPAETLFFVNDHSDDQSVALIQTLATKEIRYKIIANEGRGKKEGIETLMKHAQADWIVFFDADVTLSAGYFEAWMHSIKNQSSANVIQGGVEPVYRKNESIIQYMMYTEQKMLGVITKLSIKNSESVLLSAANLAIRRTWFLEKEPYKMNKHIPSGDDLFLLEHDPVVRFASEENASVLIQQPVYLEDYIKQRSRWASKTPAIKLPRLHILGWATLLNMLFRIVSVCIILSRVCVPISDSYMIIAWSSLIINHIFDTLVYRYYGKVWKVSLRHFLISLLYPFLFLLIFSNSLFRGKQYRRTFVQIGRK